jgi:hypothetical protein
MSCDPFTTKFPDRTVVLFDNDNCDVNTCNANTSVAKLLPVGPVEPVLPFCPALPVGPVGPVRPVFPVGPVLDTPLSPVEPLSLSKM